MFPILEFDDTRDAMLDPSRLIERDANLPERYVFCFFQSVIQTVCKDARRFDKLSSEIGPNPLYVIEHQGEDIAVLHPGIGAPLAAAFLEEAIALGGRKFIACGGAGVLDRTIDVGYAVIPERAVRDEGTSYHYLPPSREVEANQRGVVALRETLDAHDIPYITGKTWTTDAVYRETPARIARRKAEGCIVVEMETAAFFAVAEFRDVVFAQILYGGDNLDADVWDSRDWIRGQASTREKLFWLSVEAVLRL